MDIRHMLESANLKAADWNVGDKSVFRVEGIEKRKYDDGDKVVLVLDGGRFLTLNHTNLGVASNAWGGSDTDAWIGKRLEISCVRTQFAGKARNGFSVRCELPATIETRPAPRVEVNLDDQIPF